MYSAAESSSSIVADIPRLSSTGFCVLSDRFEQVEVLHVARADLEHVDRLRHALDLVDAHHLADDRQSGLAPRFGKQREAVPAEPLERVGRRPRFERAASQHRRAVRRRPRARRPSTCCAISTEHGPAAMIETCRRRCRRCRYVRAFRQDVNRAQHAACSKNRSSFAASAAQTQLWASHRGAQGSGERRFRPLPRQRERSPDSCRSCEYPTPLYAARRARPRVADRVNRRLCRDRTRPPADGRASASIPIYPR